MKKEVQFNSLSTMWRPALGSLLVLLTTFQGTWAVEGPSPAKASHPPVAGLTSESLFSNLLEHNRLRSAHLGQYTGPRTYQVKNKDGKVRAETRVLFRYQAPDTKEFKVISETGSGFIRRHVINRLMESEADAAAGRSKHDSSITPDNYRLEIEGEEDIDGYHCIVVRAIPRRPDKYLFEGKIWIHATELAIVKTEGHPAKNPSFWIKRVDFVRYYQKVGEFWLPRKDESVSDVRFFGKHILTIDYNSYQLGSS